MLTDAQAKLLLDPNFGVVATVGADGQPQTSVIWVDWDGENVVFNTKPGRAKGKNLERDPRVSISVFDHENPYRYIEIEGTATLDFEGAAESIHALSHKYNGVDYPDPVDRVIVRVRPTRVHTMGVED